MSRTEFHQVGSKLEIRNLKRGDKPVGLEAKWKFEVFGYQVAWVQIWERKYN